MTDSSTSAWRGISRVLVLLVLIQEGCRMSSPKGILGVEWGEDAVAAASRLGISCGDGWRPWEDHEGFEACQDLEHALSLFDYPVYVRLFRRNTVLEGVALRFEHCGARKEDLEQKMREAFQIGADENLHRVWSDGALVHLASDRSDDTCTLTVAGSRFGKAFSKHLLAGGLREMGRGLGPH
jgi:hypothetical protein